MHSCLRNTNHHKKHVREIVFNVKNGHFSFTFWPYLEDGSQNSTCSMKTSMTSQWGHQKIVKQCGIVRFCDNDNLNLLLKYHRNIPGCVWCHHWEYRPLVFQAECPVSSGARSELGLGKLRPHPKETSSLQLLTTRRRFFHSVHLEELTMPRLSSSYWFGRAEYSLVEP